MKVIFSESYCQILHTFSRKILPDNTSFSLRCELYSKSLLTGIGANSTFRAVFDFKKLEIIHC